MKKILLFLFFIIPVYTSALDFPNLQAEKVIVYDKTDNKILYSLKEKEKSSIASLTKIMTTITAIEKIKNLDEEVIITEEILNTVRWDASTAGLKANDKVTYRDLLYASILPSGADDTNALAILLSGNIEDFVKDMNNLKERIGLSNTNFVNTTGLDIEGHYSTAEDILKLLMYAFQNETFKTIYTTKKYELTNELVVFSTITKYHGNPSLNKIIGSKTGFTLDAGLCISVYFNSNGHEMFLITLNSPVEEKNSHIIDALHMIDFIEENYKDRVLVEKGEIIKVLPVKYSQLDNINITSNIEITKYLPSDYNKESLKIVYEGKEELNYKEKINSKIGSVQYYYQEELIGEEDIYLKEELKIDYKKIVNKYKYYLILLCFLFIIMIFIFLKQKHKKRKK